MHSTLKTLLENPTVINPPNNLNCVDEKKDADWSENFDVTSAFLGPTLWSKTLPYDDGLKLDYMDLDELLSQSELDSSSSHSVLQLHAISEKQEQPSAALKRVEDKVEVLGTWKHSCKTVRVNVDFPPEDLALALAPGQSKFDPTNHRFTEDELKPQPMCKKSKKKLVPSDLKDDNYWCRRKKNNVAAKRSRDARRAKENQIVLRASFLEKENNSLKDQLAILQRENQTLLEKIGSLMK